MPFQKYTRKKGGKKYWCIRNKDTGKETCYKSKSKRKTGIKMKYAYANEEKKS